MAAKAKHSLSKFVGFTYFRKAGTHGAWKELASARATVANIDTTAQNVDVLCDTRGSVFKGTIPEATISLTFLENADTEVLADLFGLTQTAQASGAKTVTNELYTFGSDDKVILDHFSNTGLGLTSPVIKSADGVTTYTVTDDYLVTVSDNVTTISRVALGDIPEDATISVSGSILVNASESVVLTSEFVLKQEFEVMIEAKVAYDSKDYRRTVKLNPATIESTYALEFLDVVKAGDINGATVEFKLSEGGTFKMYDEIITDAISG